jgi:hypothetical protein
MKKPKKVVLKTHTWRKILKITLWSLVVFWTLGSLRGFSLAAKVNSIPDQQQVTPIVEKQNFATSIGAQNFARNFIQDYLTWNKDNYQERVDRLKPYLRHGIDEQAGLRFDNLTTHSSYKNSELWQVTEVSENESIITLKANHTITTTVETKDAKGKVTKKEQIGGPYEKWIQVPIITDGTAFLVNGLPTFTSKPPAAEIGAIEPKTEQESINAETTAKIKEFLNTFYKQYSTGTLDELEYLTLDENVRPLGGTIIFNQIENLIVLEKKDKGYLIQVDAVFTENNAKAQILQKHVMTVSKENGRWQIIKFN